MRDTASAAIGAAARCSRLIVAALTAGVVGGVTGCSLYQTRR
jgi:hypothetical protein